MSTPLRVLVVEDSEDDTLLLIDQLQLGGYEPDYQRVQTAEEMTQALNTREWDIVIADWVMPFFSGPSAIRLLQGLRPDIPIIVSSGIIEETFIAQAVKEGAFDYVLKDRLKRIVPAVKEALDKSQVHDQPRTPPGKQRLRVLIVEDSEDDALLVVDTLEMGGYDVVYQRVELPETMKTALTENEWDIITSDFSMPRFTTPDAYKIFKDSKLDIPFIVVSGSVREDGIAEIIRLGADALVLKDKIYHLLPVVSRELRNAALLREKKQLEEERKILVWHMIKMIDQLKRSSGFLPICASCKKIKNDKGDWEQMERYITEHTGFQFSHGICPECLIKLYPDMYKK